MLNATQKINLIAARASLCEVLAHGLPVRDPRYQDLDEMIAELETLILEKDKVY